MALPPKKVSGTFFQVPWSAAGPDCCLKAQSLDDSRGPPFVAIRCPPRDRTPNGRQLGFGLRGVHVLQPACVASDGPRCQDRFLTSISMMPSPEAAPPPVLRPANQVRSQGVSLDIAAHGEEMVFRLDRERLEASLIHVAGTATVPMGMPPLRVREGKPSDKPRQFTVGVRPDHEVPMIRHQAPGKKVSAVAFDRLFENSLHRLVIGVGLKDGQACIATVENVIDHPAVRCSLWPSHGIIPVDRPHSRQEKVPDTFLTPPHGNEGCGPAEGSGSAAKEKGS